MRRIPAFIAVFTLLLPATRLTGQEPGDHQVSQELREMLTQGNDAQSDREAIRGFLARDDVRRLAAERGIDIERVESGVATLDAQDARTLADRVNDVEDQLAGGDTFVITSTTIIIILLVIILVVVA